MQFPVSLADDGLIDITIQEKVGKTWFVRFKHLTFRLLKDESEEPLAGNGRRRRRSGVLDELCKFLILSFVHTTDQGWQNRYFKASAYRARPLSPKGTLVVDGEQVPFQEFQVDVLHRLGTFLSPHPHFEPAFTVLDAEGKQRRAAV